MSGDHYQTLGVSRDATKEEITRAYFRAEEKFKEIVRAYEVLSEAETKALYDCFGETGVSGEGAGASSFDPSGVDGFSSGGATSGRGSVRGDDLRLDLTLKFREAVFGCEKEIRIPYLETCNICNGTGAKKANGVKICPTCNGGGQVKSFTRNLLGSLDQVIVCHTCKGEGQIIEEKCKSCRGQGRKQQNKKVKITIPAGADNGTRLRLIGAGDAGIKGGATGDLYVYLAVEKDSQ